MPVRKNLSFTEMESFVAQYDGLDWQYKTSNVLWSYHKIGQNEYQYGFKEKQGDKFKKSSTGTVDYIYNILYETLLSNCGYKLIDKPVTSVPILPNMEQANEFMRWIEK